MAGLCVGYDFRSALLTTISQWLCCNVLSPTPNTIIHHQIQTEFSTYYYYKTMYKMI